MDDTMMSVLEVVNGHLDTELRDTVVRTAIQVGLDNRDVIAAGFFFDEIDGRIGVKGFRKSSAAPLDMLARAVSRRLPTSPFLALSALTLWAITKPISAPRRSRRCRKQAWSPASRSCLRTSR